MATYLKPNRIQAIYGGLRINEYLIPEHNVNDIALPDKRTAQLIGVSLHNTQWISVASSTTPAEQYTRATINGAGETRVQYYVDDKSAWRGFGDDYNNWSNATGGNGPGNCNTIAIECIMSSQDDEKSLASMENAAKLIAWIFDQYGWTVDENLYTHNYWTNYRETGKCSTDLDAQNLRRVSATARCFNNPRALANANGKYCPIYILPQWEAFKDLVKKHMKTIPQEKVPADEETPAEKEKTYRVQVGSFGKHEGAEAYIKRVEASGYDAFIIECEVDGKTAWRVQVGAFSSRKNAENFCQSLKAQGLNGFVVEG